MRILMILAEWDETTPLSMLGWVVGSYYQFLDSRAEIVLASPEGGAPISSSFLSQASLRFRADSRARESFSDTLSLGQIFPQDFDAAYCVHFSIAPLKVDRGRIAEIVGRLSALGRPSALVSGYPDAEVKIVGASPSAAAVTLLELAATR